MTRNEYVTYRLGRARSTLEVAGTLLEQHFYADAINRIYNAVYYAASALLYTQKLYPKTHLGMKALFNKEFVQTGLINKQQEAIYSTIFAKRFEADYEDFFETDEQHVNNYLADAKKFVEIIEDILKDKI